MEKCHLRYAKVFHKFTCITNDCKARRKTHRPNCENLCVKTLFVTVTILSPNVLLNDSCFKIIVDTRDISTSFLPLSVDFFLLVQAIAVTIAQFMIKAWKLAHVYFRIY